MNKITWIHATRADVGRLCRCCDIPGDDWQYGLLTDVRECDGRRAYVMEQWENDPVETYFICQVQIVSTEEVSKPRKDGGA